MKTPAVATVVDCHEAYSVLDQCLRCYLTGTIILYTTEPFHHSFIENELTELADEIINFNRFTDIIQLRLSHSTDQDQSASAAVARLANLNWNLEIEDLVFDAPSNVTLQVTVLPADTTDAIAGDGIWRLGIFFSTRSDGRGDRLRYNKQILSEDYASLPLASRLPLVFLDVHTLIDVTGLGCDNWRYVCVEFAKGENPVPDFELPLPGGADFAVSCRSFPCTLSRGRHRFVAYMFNRVIAKVEISCDLDVAILTCTNI